MTCNVLFVLKTEFKIHHLAHVTMVTMKLKTTNVLLVPLNVPPVLMLIPVLPVLVSESNHHPVTAQLDTSKMPKDIANFVPVTVLLVKLPPVTVPLVQKEERMNHKTIVHV
jgi:hypothetical protein